MDMTDRKLLNLVQSSLPMVNRPYLKLGKELGLEEKEVLDRLAALKRRNVLRQISAIFDTRRLGFKTTLVAMAYDPDKLNRAAREINRHPGVSHNYAREGSYYNLWFTLAVPPDHDLEATAQKMARDTKALTIRMMPTIRFFKIGVNFDMVNRKGSSYNFSPDGFNEDAVEGWNKAQPITETDKAAIRELQEDLQLIPRPFDAMSRRLGLTTAELFAVAKEFQERRIMRRFSAVLHHRRSGFSANAMIVWEVPPERSQEVGMIMAQHNAVTHCYERPTFPDWPYTHFTMVHATSTEGCEEIEREISEATGITERRLLYSTREYKKTRVRYFVEDYDRYREAEESKQAEPAGRAR
ncbi:MAG: AsnC family transcriptional regulator [Chloroflexi bacterium]|nr:AsnC family transcriptional regulator [Chloroflexota bacterium]MCI0845713.1 AsnC family transcriptional regulator [Chloroflexota bacterium]